MPPIGRPRKYDPDAALTEAMLVFWRKGYLGASMDDLTAAMRINRASLYGAFGDKERLFLACIDRYLADNGKRPRAELDKPDIHDALHGFFRAVVENSTGVETPPGCLVACVLVGAAAETPDIRSKLQTCLAMTDEMLRVRFERAVTDKQLAPGSDVERLARLANSLRHGLTIRARAGEARADLLRTVDDAADLVLGVTLIRIRH